MPSDDFNDPSPRGGWKSYYLCVLVIAAFSLYCRIGYLTYPSMNPDEAQYAAHASYLVDAQQGPFTTPIGPVHGNAIYFVFAKLFGPYEFTPIRIYVLLVSTAMAIGVFAVAERLTGRFYALTGALFFCCLLLYFEGLSANREWFASPLAFGGVLLYLGAIRSGNVGAGWMAFSGLACGLAVLPKDQAVYFTMPVFADFACRWRNGDSFKRLALQGAAYSLGLSIAAAAYVVPFVFEGAWRDHQEFLIDFRVNQYASGGYGGLTHQSRASAIVDHLYWMLPFRRLFGAAYLVAALAVGSSLLRRSRRRADGPSMVDDDVARVFSLYLFAALVAAATGGRFFLHYALFFLPPAAVLLAIAIQWCFRARPTGSASMFLLCLLLMAFFSDALIAQAYFPRQSLELPRQYAAGIAAGVGLLAILCWAMARLKPQTGPPGRWIAVCLGALLTVESAKALFETNWYFAEAVQRGLDRQDFPAFGEWFAGHAQPGDGVPVWGWRPEIYTVLRLPAATRFATGMEVTLDPVGAPPGNERSSEKYTDMLIHDLETREPKFIVDAWLRSINGAHYRLELYPRIARWIDEHYQLAERVDDCDVYVRASKPTSNGLADRKQRATQAHRLLDSAIAKNPMDVTALLTKADLLVQEGDPAGALQWYERVRIIAPSWPIILERIDAAGKRAGGAKAPAPSGALRP